MKWAGTDSSGNSDLNARSMRKSSKRSMSRSYPAVGARLNVLKRPAREMRPRRECARYFWSPAVACEPARLPALAPAFLMLLERRMGSGNERCLRGSPLDFLAHGVVDELRQALAFAQHGLGPRSNLGLNAEGEVRGAQVDSAATCYPRAVVRGGLLMAEQRLPTPLKALQQLTALWRIKPVSEYDSSNDPEDDQQWKNDQGKHPSRDVPPPCCLIGVARLPRGICRRMGRIIEDGDLVSELCALAAQARSFAAVLLTTQIKRVDDESMTLAVDVDNSALSLRGCGGQALEVCCFVVATCQRQQQANCRC